MVLHCIFTTDINFFFLFSGIAPDVFIIFFRLAYEDMTGCATIISGASCFSPALLSCLHLSRSPSPRHIDLPPLPCIAFLYDPGLLISQSPSTISYRSRLSCSRVVYSTGISLLLVCQCCNPDTTTDSLRSLSNLTFLATPNIHPIYFLSVIRFTLSMGIPDDYAFSPS